LHNVDLIVTIIVSLGIALVLGLITQKLRFSPIVGYLLAGIIVGPYSPGFVANPDLASQLAEIGVILLMFGLGLQFHLKDLLAVRNIAVPGAILQISGSICAGTLALWLMGYSLTNGILFGIAISVASTVVLLRVLSDNKALHTPTGHCAVGWLVVEDLFTIVILVLMPAVFGNQTSGSNIIWILSATVVKLVLLSLLVLVIGQKVLPALLTYVARTGTRDLFTLAVLVLAIGIAVGAAHFFDVSMALGAFLAGLVVGQSNFGVRAASEALPIRDTFAVLFFVSVGMLFNPMSLLVNWHLILVTIAIVLLVKPAIAVLVVLMFRRPLKMAISIGVALAQVGEFTFMLGTLGMALGVLPEELNSAIIATAIISIMLNPVLYKSINPLLVYLSRHGGSGKTTKLSTETIKEMGNRKNCVILVGYGHVGRTIAPMLLANDAHVTVLEMNIDTVKKIKEMKVHGLYAIHGDATRTDVLTTAGIDTAKAIVIAATTAPTSDIVKATRSLNPRIKVFAYTTFMGNEQALSEAGANIVLSGEGAVATVLSNRILREIQVNIDEGNWKLDIITDEP